MNYDNIKNIENKIINVVYDTFALTDRGPRNIPQKVLQDHNKKGYTRNNLGLQKLYKIRLDKLIVDYIVEILYYIYSNDITELKRKQDGKDQYFIKIDHELSEENPFASYHYWREEAHPLVAIDLNANIIDLAWISYSGVGTRFDQDFKRLAKPILNSVYNKIKDHDDLLCWLMLAGLGQMFSDQMENEYGK